MLRINSKKARENIKKFILDNFVNPADLGYEEIETPTNYPETLRAIYKAFTLEKYNCETAKKYYGYNEFLAFRAWLQGLPSIFDAVHYYRLTAVEVVGDLLEESEEERGRYTEEQAEKLADTLIYNEIIQEVSRC